MAPHFLDVDDFSAAGAAAGPRPGLGLEGEPRQGPRSCWPATPWRRCSRSPAPVPGSRSRWRSRPSAGTASRCGARSSGSVRANPSADVARTLASYCTMVGARVFDHRVLDEMARIGGIPVVNLLSDTAHPGQAVGDLLTLEEHLGGPVEGRRLVFVGDGNNVAARWPWPPPSPGWR